jgi:putative hydrolase of the HAD superfamily
LVFDLDGTLYSENPDIEARFGDKIAEFFLCEQKMSEDDFKNLIKQWKSRNDADISSIVELGINPGHFMDFVCDIDVSEIEYNENLKNKISLLPHNKIIYTNSTHAHVGSVLKNLKISGLFDDVFTIRDGGFMLKPDKKSFEKFFGTYSINPAETAMIEDSLKNLKTAKDFGMTTIWVTGEKEKYPFVDYKVKDINEALDIFAK